MSTGSSIIIGPSRCSSGKFGSVGQSSASLTGKNSCATIHSASIPPAKLCVIRFTFSLARCVISSPRLSLSLAPFFPVVFAKHRPTGQVPGPVQHGHGGDATFRARGDQRSRLAPPRPKGLRHRAPPPVPPQPRPLRQPANVRRLRPAGAARESVQCCGFAGTGGHGTAARAAAGPEEQRRPPRPPAPEPRAALGWRHEQLRQQRRWRRRRRRW